MRNLMAQERKLAGDDDDDPRRKKVWMHARSPSLNNSRDFHCACTVFVTQQGRRNNKAKRRWDKVGIMIQMATMTSSKLARRAFLKERHVERMRQKREWPLMEVSFRISFGGAAHL